MVSFCRPLAVTESEWQSGSPQLRISTQKKQRQRDAMGSDGLPTDFYSPMSSFQESPRSGQPCRRFTVLLSSRGCHLGEERKKEPHLSEPDSEERDFSAGLDM